MADLPPLPALRAFEATARLGGFARAAAELNVSTSAVSHQIRALEDSLGARLLDRSTGVGGVRVTAAGQGLLRATTQALALLGAACAELRAGKRRVLTIAANAPFSALWLARRLAEFSARHPSASVNAISQDSEPDFAAHGIDLAIVHVRETALRPDDLVLLRETVFPVCSPDLLAFAATNVCRSRLLEEAHHEQTSEIDWRSWVPHFQLPADYESKIVRFSSFSQVVGAAIGGAGIALGRSPLIDSELASGRLVRIFPDLAMPASWRFVLRFPPGARRHDPMLDALVRFLREEAGDARADWPHSAAAE
jgi:DNA-binding transcriptional LysR family regulator